MQKVVELIYSIVVLGIPLRLREKVVSLKKWRDKLFWFIEKFVVG